MTKCSRTGVKLRKSRHHAFRLALDSSERTCLVEQLVGRLRGSIAAGEYRPGDILPTIRDLAKELGTSVKVPAEAMRRLADEGLVRSRPRLGSVVLAKRDTNFRGHILIVVSGGDYVYLNSMLVGSLRTRFAAAGYLVTQVSSLRVRPDVPYVLGPLKLALGGSVTFAVAVQPAAEILRVLTKSGVPFAVIGAHEPCRAKGCVGSVTFGAAAIGEFVNHCLRQGVKRVVVVGKPEVDDSPVVERLCVAGIGAELFKIDIRSDLGRPEAVQRGALESVARRLRTGCKLPDVLLFLDDWVCAGAMTALLEAGVRVPEDVCVVTLSNKGLGPVFSKAFTRMEVDHALYASVASEAVLAHLEGRRFPQGLSLSARYVEGETF